MKKGRCTIHDIQHVLQLAIKKVPTRDITSKRFPVDLNFFKDINDILQSSSLKPVVKKCSHKVVLYIGHVVRTVKQHVKMQETVQSLDLIHAMLIMDYELTFETKLYSDGTM